MFTSFEELQKMIRDEKVNKKRIIKENWKEFTNKPRQKLAANICAEVKTLGPDQTELRKMLNQERIKALGLTLIQGGKE